MDAPLDVRLSSFADDVRRLAPAFADIVERMVDRLKNGHAGETAPQIGEPMPPFVLPDENGRLVSMNQLLQKGQLVVSFNRGHWCPYCRINAAALASVEKQVAEHGGQLVLITPETQKYTRALKADSGGKFPILTDLDGGYALELHLAIQINDEKRIAMSSAGWDISVFQDNDNWTLPIPATFVVGRDGLVKGRFVDADYRKRMDVQEILLALANENLSKTSPASSALLELPQ
jgi:peroxiredoxin